MKENWERDEAVRRAGWVCPKCERPTLPTVHESGGIYPTDCCGERPVNRVVERDWRQTEGDV